MSKEYLKSLLVYVVTWFAAWNVIDFLWTVVVENNSFQFGAWENLGQPLSVAVIVWIIIVLKPWKKKED